MSQFLLRVLFFFVILFVGNMLHGQQYVDLIRITSSMTPENGFDSSSAKTFVRENLADITLPVKLHDSLALVTGFLYENLYAKPSEERNEYASVHGITFKMGLSMTHNDRWKSTMIFMPKLSSDLMKVNRNDAQFGGTLIFKYKKSDSFSWQFGGYFNTELFGPFFVPFLGLYYHSPNEKFEANVLLPASVDMNYTITPKLRFGGSFLSFVKTFHLHQQYGVSPTSYWNKSTNELFAYAQIEPFKGFLIQGRAGYSVARRFSLYDTTDKIDGAIMAFKFGDDRIRRNQWFEDGAIFQVRLIYRHYL